MMKPLISKLENENTSKAAGISISSKAINLKDIPSSEMHLGKMNACLQDANTVSETDSTTHNSDVWSHKTMDDSFAQESDAELISLMSENNEIEN